MGTYDTGKFVFPTLLSYLFTINSFKSMFKQSNGSSLTIVSTSHPHKNVSFKCIFYYLHFVL